jgi:hypothetical protein
VGWQRKFLSLIVGNALGIYEREVRFYAELAGSVPIRVPECYFGRIDDTGSILLLEDIRDLQVGDQVAGITEREAERIVDALAALHATFWEHQDLESMKQSVRDLGPHLPVFEASCFDGRYITGDVSPEYLDRIEAARNAATDAAEDTGPKAQMNLQFSMLNADSR